MKTEEINVCFANPKHKIREIKKIKETEASIAVNPKC